jgi:hypothetical protein
VKLKEEFYKKSILSEFGFVFEVEDPECANSFNEIDFEIVDKFVCALGHSRRGQHYYLTIHPETFEIYVYANEADGRGTHIMIGDVLFRMFEKGMVEESEY